MLYLQIFCTHREDASLNATEWKNIDSFSINNIGSQEVDTTNK